MNAAWIHISEVLAEIEKLEEFSIGWVRDNKSRNGARGSIKRVAKARKGVRSSRRGKSTGQKKTPDKWQFKNYQGVPIIDVSTDQLLTPKFTHIVEFNGQKVRHFGT